MKNCTHSEVECINPYELIRKYRCITCGEVMMCACEEKFARRFLPHQLKEGSDLNTRQRIPVTLGFQEGICNTCRGLPEKAYPKAEIYGLSSKIRRYYWREIFFETTQKFADWAESQGDDYASARNKHQDKYDAIEKEVVKKINALHEHTPKYTYQEESQSDVLRKNIVKVVDLVATYVKQPERKVGILEAGKVVSVEEFAASYYRKQGYEVLFTESIPFHVIFGIFMWLLLQHPADPEVQIVMFGDRKAFEEGNAKGQEILTHLPRDFGTPGYSERRASVIEEHFAMLPKGKENLLSTFDYWVKPSEGLRQYLWAHRPEDVQKAREIVSILPTEVIYRILKYLIGDYWHRYVGWPDLLVHNSSEYLFVEVKSSKDKLREDQKEWIKGNTAELHLPFELVKIHKQNSQ